MNGSGFVFEIWKLACVRLIKSPLNPYQNKGDEDGGIAVNFKHGL